MDASQVGNAYEHALRELATAQTENARMRTALEDLIACKDMKEALDGLEPSKWNRYAEDLNEEYKRRKPLAWKAARAAIAARALAHTGRALAPEERALTAGSGK